MCPTIPENPSGINKTPIVSKIIDKESDLYNKIYPIENRQMDKFINTYIKITKESLKWLKETEF